MLAASIAVVLFTLWFLFTAKSVRMNFSAATQAISLSGGFHIEFGNVFLLRRGEYEVVATAEGYETFSSKFEVNDERNQTLFFDLTPTPGLLGIEVTPEDALFQVEGLQSWTKAISGRARTASSCGRSRVNGATPSLSRSSKYRGDRWKGPTAEHSD